MRLEMCNKPPEIPKPDVTIGPCSWGNGEGPQIPNLIRGIVSDHGMRRRGRVAARACMESMGYLTMTPEKIDDLRKNGGCLFEVFIDSKMVHSVSVIASTRRQAKEEAYKKFLELNARWDKVQPTFEKFCAYMIKDIRFIKRFAPEKERSVIIVMDEIQNYMSK